MLRYFSRLVSLLFFSLLVVPLSRGDSLSIDISSVVATAPTRVAVGSFVLIPIAFDSAVDYPECSSSSSCGGDSGTCSYGDDEELTTSITTAPTGAQTDTAQTGDTDPGDKFFYFRADTPGTYEITATISGTATFELRTPATDSDSVTIPIEVFEPTTPTNRFVVDDVYDDAEFSEQIDSDFVYNFEPIYRGYETTGRILSADLESQIVFTFTDEDATDANSTYLAAVIDDVSYQLPIYTPVTTTGLEVMIKDTDGDGMDEIYVDLGLWFAFASFTLPDIQFLKLRLE